MASRDQGAVGPFTTVDPSGGHPQPGSSTQPPPTEFNTGDYHQPPGASGGSQEPAGASSSYQLPTASSTSSEQPSSGESTGCGTG